jgi:hypothetical protein
MSELNGKKRNPERLRPKAYEPGKEPQLTEAARQMVEDLIESNGGRLPTQEQLVAAARPKDSPLHKYFDWDDSISGKLRLPEYADT